jgi:hypothetical protein
MQAYEVASRYREVDHEAEASRVLGDVTVLASPTVPDAAERHYRTGLALATPRGARPLTAHCHLGLGRLLVRTGRREDSRQHLATAITMYREMAMQLWLRKAEAAWEAGRLD